jgi:hypothetical protein
MMEDVSTLEPITRTGIESFFEAENVGKSFHFAAYLVFQIHHSNHFLSEIHTSHSNFHQIKFII